MISQRFVYKEDDNTPIIVDKKHNLEWMRDLQGLPSMTWEEAMNFCENMGKGWRLPHLTELHSILDNKEEYPMLSQDFYVTGIWDNWYWSCTTDKHIQEYAWGVHMGNGKSASDLKVLDKTLGGCFYAWPVREAR